jgi:hypothetical protein
MRHALLLCLLLMEHSAWAQADKVCPNMPAQQALAAGCRFLGSYGGYDLCANPGAQNYPQCAAMYTPNNAQPSQYQVWVGVIMPTQNCENYDASHNGHYDCSVWCRAFLHDNSTPVSRPQLPAICAKYISSRPRTAQCQAAVPPVAAAGPYPQQTIANMMELWKRRIDTYWFQEFNRQGLPAFRPAMLVLSNNPNDDLYEDDGTRSITYNPAFVNGIIGSAGGVFGSVIALAHEEGHWVQFLIGRHLQPQIRQELNADTLSGDWLRWAEQQGFVHQCDLGVALMGTFQARDPPGLHLPAFDPTAHGTAQRRVAAVMKGFNENGPNLSGPNPFVKPSPFHSPLIPNTN